MLWFAILGQIIVGWLLADFLSGVVHFWEDRVLNLNIPIIGEAVVRPNREHHTDPLDFTRATLLKRNTTLWIATGIVAIPFFILLGPTPLFFAMLLGGLVVNEVHYYAHLPKRANSAIKILQEMGLIQSPQQHQRHHKHPSDKTYCILTNFLNPLLDFLHFWDRLEDGLTFIGLEPNRGTA